MTEEASKSSKSLSLTLRNVYETLAISWPTVVDAALRRVTKAACDDRLASWAEKIVRHTALALTVRGREHLAPGKTYLVMSNHQSLYDVPVLFFVLGKNIRMITKKELFDVPIFGPAMREAGFISIDRANRQSAMESLAIAKEKMAAGTHVWIAPEGTRSKTGALSPFKKGGFALAMEAGLEVLPVTIDGTRNILVAKGLRSNAGAKVTITFHATIDAKSYKKGNAGREQLMADVRAAIQSGFEPAR
ncbi:MAG: lysophospholipid acyltransferase family protein [Polyangiaceae bacterium]